MNFAFTEEQEELRKTVRQFLDAKSAEAAVREQMETENGFDAAVWSQMGEQMGLQGLIVPEEFGGSGYSYVELGIVLEEMGRSLLCAPFFTTVVLAANTLIHSGDEAAKAAPTCPASPAARPSPRSPTPSRPASGTRAGITMQASRLAATAVHAHRHQDVRARRPHRQPDHRRRSYRQRCQPVRRRGRRCWSHPYRTQSTMDQTRKQAKLEFANTPAKLVGAEGKGWDVLNTRARSRRRRPRRRAGRWRPEGARNGCRVRQGARAVRPADRFVPGDQAQVRRHAARSRVGQERLLTTACGAPRR